MHLELEGGPELEACRIAIERATRGRQAIDLADEGGDEAVGGMTIELDRRRHLLDLPPVHHHDAVGEAQGLSLIVGHEHGRESGLAVELLELDLHLRAQVLVEGRERLVEQQHLGADDDRARECHALLLAAGELAHAAALETGELDHLERLAHLGRDLAFREPAHL